MIKVVVIFAMIVCVIMVLGCSNKSRIVSGSSDGTETKMDIQDYSKKHARSIQDDVKKVVSKNI